MLVPRVLQLFLLSTITSTTTSATTPSQSEQLTEALRQALGGTAIFSIGTDTNIGVASPVQGISEAGSKYLVEVDPKGVDTWSEEEVKAEQARVDILPRLMTTQDGTMFRCAIPIPKIFLPSISSSSSASSSSSSPSSVPTTTGSTTSRKPTKKTPAFKKMKIKDMSREQQAGIVLNASKLLSSLDGVCFRKVEGWWTYELCMNEKVRQYHTERQPDPVNDGMFLQVEVNSYVLGKYDNAVSNDPPTSTTTTTTMTTATKKKKKRRHSPGYNLDISHTRPLSLIQTFQWGTPCDLTNKPRETKLEFSCGASTPGYNTFIEEIQEIATCTYAIKIKTPLLCDHVDFKDTAIGNRKAGGSGASSDAAVETIKCHPVVSQLDSIQVSPPRAGGAGGGGVGGETTQSDGRVDANMQAWLKAQSEGGSFNIALNTDGGVINNEQLLDAMRKLLGQDELELETIVLTPSAGEVGVEEVEEEGDDTSSSTTEL